MNLPETKETITYRGFKGVDVRRDPIFPELFSAQENLPEGVLLDALNMRFTPDGRAYGHRNQLKIKSPTNLTGGVLPTALVEFVNSAYSQVLCFASDGTMQYLPTDWSSNATQWVNGYELFAAGTWVQGKTSLPTTAYFGFADAHERLFVSHGGMATGMWDGVNWSNVGLATPTTAPTGAADATGTNHLIPGTYSYRVAVGNADFESLYGPIVDVTMTEVAASGWVQTVDDETVIVDGDAITIDGLTYTFRDVATDAYDVQIYTSASPSLACRITLSGLAYTIKDGYPFRGCPPHPSVTTTWSGWPEGGTWRFGIVAREVGADGNSIALSEVDPYSHFTLSDAHLTGGVTNQHIDLAAIPTGPSGITFRKLYRAYTEDVADGARGAAFQYLTTINDNSTTAYADDTPQSDLGEEPAFDHAIPPHGNLLVRHRDRLYMAGVTHAGESYKAVAAIIASTGAIRSGSAPNQVITFTTSTPHGINIGETVVVEDVDDPTMEGTFVVTAVTSTTAFKVASAGTNGSSGSGTVTSGIQVTKLRNVLFYSQLDEPYYWPAENQITVGSSAAIVGLVSWYEQLIILKEDSVWVLSGYGDADFMLRQVPGAPGATGNHAAGAPSGVLYAGHEGWTLCDGQQAQLIAPYHEAVSWTHDPPPLAAPQRAGSPALAPSCAYHAGRFHVISDQYVYSWQPVGDVWEVAHRWVTDCGLRAFTGNAWRSHLLAYAAWGSLTSPTFYITVFDNLFKRMNAPNGNYYDTAGTGADAFRGEVRVEFPPLVAAPGETVNPLEAWVYGNWTVPASSADDLRLYVFDPATATWADLGVVTQNAKKGIPPGYARARLRLVLKGNAVPYLALHSVSLGYQRRSARG